MKFFQFASYIWISLLPFFAIAKGIWLFINRTNSQFKEFNSLQNYLPETIYEYLFLIPLILGLVIIFIITYMLFSYNKAFIYQQENYFSPVLLSIALLSIFSLESFSILFAVGVCSFALVQFLSLSENSKLRDFFTFDMGLTLGFALLININLILLAIVLFSFLFLYFDLSRRKILQYLAGCILPFIFYFPYTYFSDKLYMWEEQFTALVTLQKIALLNVTDYIIIGILFITVTTQTIRLLFIKKLKPKEQSFIIFLLIYFIVSLFIGIFKYPEHFIYLLVGLPPLYLFHSFGRQEKNYPLLISLLAVALWVSLANLGFIAY